MAHYPGAVSGTGSLFGGPFAQKVQRTRVADHSLFFQGSGAGKAGGVETNRGVGEGGDGGRAALFRTLNIFIYC